MASLSASETKTEFQEQRKLVHELQDRLADAEHQLLEGEMLRKKLHNTILVITLDGYYFLSLPCEFIHAEYTVFVGTERQYSGILSGASFVTR